MEKSKRKNGELNTKRYWQIFGTLAIILLVMVRFPVRIMLYETLYDALIYGSLALGCLYTAIHVYRWSKWQFRRLIVVILLCASLSGWQVLDLTILRTTYVVGIPFGYVYRDSDFIGVTWYTPRFPIGNCFTISEDNFGNEYIAIAIKHTRSFNGCGAEF